MCGFGGYYQFIRDNSIENPREILNRIVLSLRLRGPDSSGIYFDENLGFAHARLSILDVSDAGNQPMKCATTGVVIAFNGECYNFNELRSDLELRGVTFRGKSDTEVVLMQYIVHGIVGLKNLQGVFGFSIWDPRNKIFLLMRDRLGVKPLYYSFNNENIIFGSEIKAIKAFNSHPMSLNTQTLSEYMWFGCANEDRTIFNEVKSLPPGSMLISNNGVIAISKWWDIANIFDSVSAYSDYKISDLQNKIDISVARQLVSDVPLGIFLSSGIDSTTIAASALHLGHNKISTYTAKFGESSDDESSAVKEFARKYGIVNHTFNIDKYNLLDVLKQLVIAHDEPFADAANVPLYLMSKAINDRFGIKVVLQGDGGDELFAGYRRYALMANRKLISFIPNSLPKILATSRLVRLIQALKHPDDAMKMALMLTTDTLSSNTFRFFKTEYRHFLFDTTDPFVAYRNANERFKRHNLATKMMLTDMVVQLPNQYLVKVDRSTMAAGIESRVPLLDEYIVDYALPMPLEYKINKTRGKDILRKALNKRLDIRSFSKKKYGFGVPFSKWLVHDLRDSACEMVLDESFLERFNFDKIVLEKALINLKEDDHAAGYQLWKVFQLALWHEKNK